MERNGVDDMVSYLELRWPVQPLLWPKFFGRFQLAMQILFDTKDYLALPMSKEQMNTLHDAFNGKNVDMALGILEVK